MLTKKFYPWAEQQRDNWLVENASRVNIKGTLSKDYVPRDSKRPAGKMTIIYYEEKNESD